MGGGSSSPQQQHQRSKSDQKQGEKQQQNQPDKLGKEPKDQSKDDPKDPGETRHDQSSAGSMPEVGEGELKSRNGQGRWGRLPKTVIEQVYENGKRQLPARYRVLLEEYFRRLPKQVQED